MSRFSAKLLCGSALVAAAFIAAPASAQTVTRIVAFGDSYADDGNFFELTGIPRPAVYPNGRFSDRTNFVDTMSLLLGVPVDNFAIGGAFTGNGNINGVGPGFVTEYQSFLAGGGPAAFPRVTGHFSPTDLAVISIGGNDARAYERSLGLSPTSAQISTLVTGAPAQAAVRVTEATAGVSALVNAGARNVTFLVGDVGRLPEVAGLPVAQVGTAYANAFSTGMQASLSNFAAGGVIVNYLDLSQVGNVVQGNPAAFGLISAGACPTACLTTDPSLIDKYLFYVDQVHLTSKGFEIVGRYAVRQLEAPLQLQAQTDTGLQAAMAFGSTLSGRMDLSAARSGGEGGGLRFFVTGNAASEHHRRGLMNLDYEIDTVGGSAGLEYEASGIVLGGAVNYSRPKADIETASGDVRAKAWQVGGYAGWSAGGAFVQAYGGYGWLDYDIRRQAVVDEIHATTHGTNLFAGGKAGYLVALGGGGRVGPVVGVQYAKAKLDGYTESGDPVLTLNVGPQEVHALVGSAGLEARGDFTSGGLAVQPYASVTAEKDLEGDGRTIRYAGTPSPGIVNRWVLPDRSKETYGRFTAGANLSLGGAVSLQVQGSASFGRNQGNDMGAFAGVKLGF
ncbi:MAG: autotransporter domain-containing protein [Alphaproteobacteria bacterium]|nr:autotransporter domain-containing protein [Alphaproteobacteria bacterium]MBV9373181.1 autotransporter domain-containing protein [Alphaproteobacteria bacterium]MBV9900270.1 autotransporter domain-containing protein [Alphaproteobacteria bacterium]